MQLVNGILTRYFAHFSYFYAQIGNRVFIALSVSLLVGVLDGFGLAMFLPLIQVADGQQVSSYEVDGMGNLAFIVNGMHSVGLPFTLSSVLLVMLGFFILKGFFKFLEGYIRVVNQRYFIKRLRFSNIDLLESFQYKSFVLSDAGRIQNTFSGEVERVVTAYRSYFNAVQFGVLVFVYVGLAFMANAQFAVLVALGGIATNFIYKYIYKATKRLSRELTRRNHTFQGLLMQNVLFFKYLKATGLLALYGKKLKSTILEIERSAKKIGLYSSALQAIREPLIVVVVVGVILFQVNFMNEQLGSIILSLLFFYRSLSFLMTVQNHWNTYLGVSGSLENMTEFSAELAVNAEIQGTTQFSEFSKNIELRRVGLSYGNYEVLKDVSLEIKKFETVAIVGESGSGKTSLMNVIAALIPPDSGNMFIDGVDALLLDRRSFQRRVGYITQDPVIFNDTIFNNVTLWARPTPENYKRFHEVLTLSHIFEFTMSLPEKELTIIGNNGISISGGQRQRLSIARELFKEVDILLLDEATSALDSDTERVIQENIFNLKGAYTIIIIAHRLSTVRYADRIFLLQDGKLVSTGTFDRLTEVSPEFKRMVELQAF